MDNELDEGCPSDPEQAIVEDSGTAAEENVETFYHYKMSRAKSQPTVLVCLFESKGLSFQLWPAAKAMCWYLENEFGEAGMWLPPSANEDIVVAESLGHPVTTKGVVEIGDAEVPRVVDEIIKPTSGNCQSGSRRMRVLELGSGTGLVGIAAACMGADVVLTDLPHVLPNTIHNMDVNRGIVQAAGGSVEAKVLRWGVEDDVKALGDLSAFDLILGSDVVYYDTLYKPLLQTLKWLVGADGDEATFADKRNSKSSSITTSTPTDPPEVPLSTPFAYNSTLTSSPGELNAPSEIGRASYQRHNNGLRGLAFETNPGTRKTPVIHLGHMKRWKKDSHFFRQASKWFDIHVVLRHPPEDNARVGPIVYRLTVKSSCLPNSAQQRQD